MTPAEATTPAWNGRPLVLQQNQSVALSTPNGSMVLSVLNKATQNNAGTLQLTSGGATPISLDAEALAIAPTIFVQDWAASCLTLTNTSPAKATPIAIQAYGPGMPGMTIAELPADGSPKTVTQGEALQGKGTGGAMQITFAATSGIPALFALIGGPADSNGNNAYVFAVNFQQNTTPPGYYETVMGNTLTYAFSWTTSLFVAYFGPGQVEVAAATLPTATVTLVSLTTSG